jgi:hypothetical protein
MTQAKKLKRAIRERARKTGESYTAARRQVLLKARQKRTGAAVPRETRPAPVARTASPSPRTSATRGVVAEATVVEKTGRGLDHWFAVLDAFGGDKGHTALADHLFTAHAVPGWYAQAITLAYEREHGLRQPNQASTGDFQVSVSRVVPATVADVADAIRSPRRRARWLRGADRALVEAFESALTGPKPRPLTLKDAGYARMRYRWDGSTVEIHVLAKPRGASVVASNTGLSDARLVEERRAAWKVALDALKAHLSS